MDARRDRLVEEMKAEGAITSARIEAALRTVARHRLLERFYITGPGAPRPRRIDHDPDDPEPEHLDLIYADRSLVTRMEDRWPTSSTSQPSLVARMLELLDPEPGMRVLEIGTGTGYNAALLAELVGDQRLVVSVDITQDVVAQTMRLLTAAGYGDVVLICRDGFEGAAEHGPFDRIVATVACPDLSPRWAEQLAPDGAMLIPLEHAGCHPLIKVENSGGVLHGRVVGHSGFMAARGGLAPLEWWRARLHVPPDYQPNLNTPPEAAPHVEPAWEAFGNGEPIWGGRCTTDQLDLGFYVAVRDRRAIWGGDHVGLTEGAAGWVLATASGIRWLGDRRLRDDLHSLHRDWTALGRPAVSAYELTFLPHAQGGHHPRGSSWQVDRRYFVQQTTLPRSPT